MRIGYNSPRDGFFQTLHADNLTITNVIWAGSNITAPNITATNNVNVSGSVYSQDGIQEYSNLLYTHIN